MISRIYESLSTSSEWGNWAADEFELQVFLYGAILCDNVEEEEEGRKLQITVGICRRRQKKRNICAVEIASCATLLCFEIETLQVVLHKPVAGVRNRTTKDFRDCCKHCELH